MSAIDSNQRCGIVLAGGRGRRLGPFIHRLKGSSLPKQYVNFIGARSMLEHSFDRAERLISRERLLTVVARDHLNYRQAEVQLSVRTAGTVVIQPEDRDTGPGVLLPLMHLHKRHPDAVVAVFPSTHFILEEDVFMAHVGMAFYLVESDPSRIIVLGIEPEGLELEEGYILPDGDGPESAPSGTRGIRLFIDDLAPEAAPELIGRGVLQNTMTLVFRPDTVLELVRTFFPRLYGLLHEIQRAIGTRKERAVVEEAYRRMEPMSFEKGILQTFALLRPSQLSVLPVSEVFWSDWKSERNVLNALKHAGYLYRLHEVAGGRISANALKETSWKKLIFCRPTRRFRRSIGTPSRGRISWSRKRNSCSRSWKTPSGLTGNIFLRRADSSTRWRPGCSRKTKTIRSLLKPSATLWA